MIFNVSERRIVVVTDGGQHPMKYLFCQRGENRGGAQCRNLKFTYGDMFPRVKKYKTSEIIYALSAIFLLSVTHTHEQPAEQKTDHHGGS